MFRASGLWCIAAGLLLSAHVRGDELKFLPDKPSHIVSIDLAGFLKSQAYADLQKDVPQIKEKFGKDMEQELGLSAAKIARISMGGAMTEVGEEFIGMVRTLEPVKWDEIKANRMKGRRYRINVHFEEVKIGAYTAYQEKYQFQFRPEDKPGEVQKGDIMCVVDDKLVLYSRPETMRKVLERKGGPDLGTMEKGLKVADLKGDAVMLFNLQDMSERSKERMKREFGKMPGAEDVMKGTQVVALQGKLGAKVDVTATAICKDEEAAAGVKKAAEGVQVGLKLILGVVQGDQRSPMEARELAKSGAAILDSIKMTTKGSHAIAEVSADSAVLVKMIVMAVTLESKPPADTKPDAKPQPKEDKKP